MRRNSMTDTVSIIVFIHNLLRRHKVELNCTRNIRSICDLCAYSDFVQFALINATKTLANHHSPFLFHVIFFMTLTIVIHLRITRFEIRLRQPTNDCEEWWLSPSEFADRNGFTCPATVRFGRYRGKVKVIIFVNLYTKVSGRPPDES